MRTHQSVRLRHNSETQNEQSRRRVNQIETMIAEFDRMCIDLGHQIEADEKLARIDEPAHFAYPTYAKAARVRRTKLQQSITALKTELDRLSAYREAA